MTSKEPWLKAFELKEIPKDAYSCQPCDQQAYCGVQQGDCCQLSTPIVFLDLSQEPVGKMPARGVLNCFGQIPKLPKK